MNRHRPSRRATCECRRWCSRKEVTREAQNNQLDEDRPPSSARPLEQPGVRDRRCSSAQSDRPETRLVRASSTRARKKKGQSHERRRRWLPPRLGLLRLGNQRGERIGARNRSEKQPARSRSRQKRPHWLESKQDDGENVPFPVQDESWRR